MSKTLELCACVMSFSCEPTASVLFLEFSFPTPHINE